MPSAVSLMGIGKSPSAGKTTAGMGRGRADPFEVVQQPATGGRADEDVMVGEAGRPGIGQNSEPIEEVRCGGVRVTSHGVVPAAQPPTGSHFVPLQVANGMEARSPLPATPGMHRLPVLSATHTQSSYRQPRHGKRRRSPNGGPHRVGGPPPHDLEDVSRNIGGTPASVAPALDGLWVAIFSVLQECQGGDFPVRALRSEVLGVFSTVSAANAACKASGLRWGWVASPRCVRSGRAPPTAPRDASRRTGCGCTYGATWRRAPLRARARRRWTGRLGRGRCTTARM